MEKTRRSCCNRPPPYVSFIFLKGLEGTQKVLHSSWDGYSSLEITSGPQRIIEEYSKNLRKPQVILKLCYRSSAILKSLKSLLVLETLVEWSRGVVAKFRPARTPRGLGQTSGFSRSALEVRPRTQRPTFDFRPPGQSVFQKREIATARIWDIPGAAL